MAAIIGGQFMVLSQASVDVPYFSDLRDMVNPFDWGAKAGFEYRIFQNITLRLDLYFGLNSIGKKEEGKCLECLPRRNRQFTLGLNYYLTKEIGN